MSNVKEKILQATVLAAIAVVSVGVARQKEATGNLFPPKMDYLSSVVAMIPTSQVALSQEEANAIGGGVVESEEEISQDNPNSAIAEANEPEPEVTDFRRKDCDGTPSLEGLGVSQQHYSNFVAAFRPEFYDMSRKEVHELLGASFCQLKGEVSGESGSSMYRLVFLPTDSLSDQSRLIVLFRVDGDSNSDNDLAVSSRFEAP